MAYPSPRRLQLRRGNASAISSYLGYAGELVVDTSNWTLYVHDGVTVGGYAATVNTASISGNINSILNGTAVFGNIIPSANTVYSLGNITHQWKSLFVSNSTIYVGGVPLSIDTTGNLTVNGNIIPTIGYVNASVANVTVDLSSYALNANVSAANVGLKGYVDQANSIQSSAISSANIAIKGYIDQQITDLIGGAPSILDTLNEIAASINDDANVYTSLINSIATANTALKGYVDQANTIQSAQLTSANLGIIGYIDQANTIQSAQVGAANLAITAANVGMRGYVDSQSFYSNVKVATYLQSGNIANVSVAGNVTATYFLGNGALLTGIVASGSGTNYSNTNVIAYLNATGYNLYSNVNLIAYLAGNITTGNVTATGFIGNGAGLTNVTFSQAGNIVGTQSNVTLQAGTFTSVFNNQGNVTMPNVYVSGNVTTGGYFIGNGALLTGITAGSSYSNVQVATYLPTYDGVVTASNVAVNGNVTAQYFLGNGALLTGIVGGAGNYSNIDVKAYLATGDGVSRLIQGYYANLDLGATARLYSYGSSAASFLGHDGFANVNINYVRAGQGDIQIATNNGDHNWTFSNAGNLTLPSGGRILESTYFSADSIILKPNGGTSTQYLEIAPTAVDGNHVHLMTGSGTELFLGDDNHYVKLANTGGVVINSNDGIGNTAQWTFSNAGNLTFPSNNLVIKSKDDTLGNAAVISSGNFVVILSNGASGGTTSLWAEDYANIGTSNIAAVYANPTVGSKIVRIAVGQNGGPYGPNLWDFGNTGTTRFPGDIILAPAGQSITMQSDQYSQLMWQNANVTVAPDTSVASNFYVAQNSATLDIVYRDGSSNQQQKSWLWSLDGNLKLPSGGYILNSDDSIYGGGSYSNVQVATYLPTYSGALQSSNVQTTTANIQSLTASTNNATGALRVMGGVGVGGNVSIKLGQQITVGIEDPSANVAFPERQAIFIANANVASGINVRNFSTSGGASSNYVAVADNNQGDTHYAVFGIAGSGFNAGGPLIAPNDAYLSTIGGNLVINSGASQDIIIAGAGGTVLARFRSTTANVSITASAVSTSTTTGALTVSGGVGVGGNLNVGGNVTATYFVGNGALLTGITSGSSYSNVQVATYLPTYTGNIANVRLSSSGVLTFPDGSQQTTAAFGGGGNYGNANVAAFLPTYTGTTGITAVGTLATLSVTGNTTVGNLVGTEANTRIIANVYTTTFDIYGNVSFPGNVSATNFVGSGSLLSGVAIKTTGSWTVPTGNSTQSFTVPTSGTYQLWVDCNIPNGILAWNATATVTNSNVPVVGQQFAWVYNGGGTPIDFTSIPNQFVGTGNTIVRSSVAPSATTNRFDFGLNNTSGGNVTVSYGYVKIS